MFRFENPECLYLLVAVPLLALLHYWTSYRKRRRLRAYGDPALLRGLMRDVSRWRGEVKTWCLLVALICLIMAAARPQYGTKIETVERRGIEAIIAMDVSNSMLATDIRPSRLDRAKMLFSNMIDGMRNDMVGLVAFAGDAFLQLPVTGDYVSAKMFLDQLTPSLIRVQGTDIGAAIDLAMQSFTQKKDVSRAIFVITDGEDHEGGAVEAAKAAAKKGIHVYMLGVGSPDGAHVPIPGTGQYFIDDEGNAVVSRLNEDMCREVAKAGDGAYIYVNNSTTAQEDLSKYVEKLAKSKLDSEVFSEYDEQYQGFLLLALFFLLVDVLLLERENRIIKSLNVFRRFTTVLLLCLLCGAAQAQSYRDYIRRGNRLFRDSIFDRALVEYNKAYEADSTNVPTLYNFGNAKFFQGVEERSDTMINESFMHLLEASKMERNPARRAKIFHNLGVIMQGKKQFRQAIDFYKESLRNNPHDDETRYNMVLCQRQLKDGDDDQQQQQQEQQQQQQDQQQQQQQQQEQQQQEQPQPQENSMNQDNAEQMLKAALQKERQTQDKLQRQMQQPQSKRLQKQW